MAIFKNLFQRISGVWSGETLMHYGGDDARLVITPDNAMKLSAVWACVNLRAETIGTLPFHLRDEKKNIIRDHDLYNVIHNSPNSMQTASEYWSMAAAQMDIFGEHISIAKKRVRDKSIISLEPIDDPRDVELKQKKTGEWYYTFDGEDFPADEIFHLRGFTLSGYRPKPRLEIGREILGAQLRADAAAIAQFKSGLKTAGFFETSKDLNSEKLNQLDARMKEHAKLENAGKWLTLPVGLKPIAGSDFAIKATDAQLLESRAFGIEEVCRLFSTPPQLIGHTDKASSWASSAEQINLQYLMYGINPTLIRIEQRAMKSLTTQKDRVAGLQAKFSVQGLLRADMETQYQFFASALQNGYYNRDEVRDLLERGEIPGGKEYTVQLNMGKLGGKDNVSQDQAN